MKRKGPPDSPLLFDMAAGGPDDRLEREARKSGFKVIAGTDEAGRGPLAGPVVAAAVILDPRNIPEGLNDSKSLTAAERAFLFDAILASAEVAIASSSAGHIDRSDIRKASLDAMRRAVAALPQTVDFVLVDGRDVPPGLACPAKAVIKGDARSLSIAAASIIAKVTRDRMMEQADTLYPDYGFAQHAGYATAQHRAAIISKGACPLHRLSFRPLRKDEG